MRFCIYKYNFNNIYDLIYINNRDEKEYKKINSLVKSSLEFILNEYLYQEIY